MSKRNSILLISSSTITRVGDTVFEYAIRWWVASKSNSASLLAFIMSLETIVDTLFNLVGGVFADRYDRKKILILTDIINGLACLFLFFTISDSQFAIIILCIVNIILSISYSFYSPAIKSIVVEIIEEKKFLK